MEQKKVTILRLFSLVITLLFAVVMPISAQLSVGIQGGANLSKMDFTNNQAYRFTKIDYQPGFIGGLVVQFLGDKHAGIQAEINFSQRGWVENDTTGVQALKIRNRMDYVEIPVLTHINIGGGKLRGVFNIGPYLGFGLNRTITTENLTTGASETTEYEFDSSKDNLFDYGLMVGGGMEYRFGFGKITTEVRYTVGLGDINKEKFFQSEVSQFRILALLVRYTIPFSSLKD